MEETKKKVGRPPGLPKTGGRQKGTRNTKNVAMENNVRLFVTKNWEEMTRAWMAIEDNYKKVKAFTDIMNYAYPKMRSVEFKGEVKGLTLEERLKEALDQGSVM